MSELFTEGKELKPETDVQIRDAITNWYFDYIDYLIDNYYNSYMYGELTAHQNMGKELTDTDEMKMGDNADGYAQAYGDMLRDEGASVINGEKVPWLKDFDAETRSKITDIIASGDEKDKVKEQLDTYFDQRSNRAEKVAVTEVNRVKNYGTLDWYKANGKRWVLVQDNEGPNSCAECGIANGQVWSVEYAQGRELEHPSCVRVFMPTTHY